MSNFELFLIFVFLFFGLIQVPKFVYRNNVGAIGVITMIGAWCGLVVLFIKHFFPN